MMSLFYYLADFSTAWHQKNARLRPLFAGTIPWGRFSSTRPGAWPFRTASTRSWYSR